MLALPNQPDLTPVQHERNGHYRRVHACDVCEGAFVQNMAAENGGLENSVQRTLAHESENLEGIFDRRSVSLRVEC